MKAATPRIPHDDRHHGVTIAPTLRAAVSVGASPLRIAVDLQACQTEGSQGRGVGRYSEGLVRSLADRIMRGDDLRLCMNGAYTESVVRLSAAFDMSVGRQRISVYRYPPLARQIPGARTPTVEIAEALVRRHWLSLQPDILHVSHVFEGMGGNAVVPRTLPSVPGMLRSATLYDLIPLRFPDWYFADPHLKHWYLEKIAVLRQFDHLLAISDATRSDAIELLGIDPSRISTIWGAVDASFTPAPVSPEEASDLRRRYGLRKRFVLYTGGDEYRKNLEGALAGFAQVPQDRRRDVQLVVVCAMAPDRRRELLRKAARLGVDAADVVFTDFVPHSDLVRLYRLCDVFVFPSFYEGLGLPVLEAMSCGAAAIGGDNSSIREIIERADARFDPRSPISMGETLSRVLGDGGYREALRAYGLERGRAFSWERTAQQAIDALRDAHERLKPASVMVTAGRLPRKRLAVFTPLPPCRSGIADYNAAFLPWLARYFEIDVFVDAYEVGDETLKSAFRIFDHRLFASRSSHYDAVMYELGNSSFHAYMLDTMQRFPGIVVLHDAYLSGLYRYVEFHLGQAGSYGSAMLHSHGPRARRYLAPVQQDPDPAESAMVHLPATKDVLEGAIGLISHSPFNVDIARNCYPEGWRAPYRVVPQMVAPVPSIGPEQRLGARGALALGADDFVICTFGHVAWTKCGDVLLDAFENSVLARDARARLVFVGELSHDRFGHELRNKIARSALSSRISVTGYVDESVYRQYLCAADVAVQLRIESRGGTPKGVLDCLASGIPVVLNDAASYTDYPHDVVVKIPPAPDGRTLAGVLDSLYCDRERRLRLGDRARAYVASEHGPEPVAARYALVIDEFIQRGASSALGTTIREIATALNDGDASPSLLDEAAGCLHEAVLRPLFPRARLLVDVSHLASTDHETGIPRVVKNILRWFYCSNRAGFDPVAVRLQEGRLVEASDWLDANGLLAPGERSFENDASIVPRWGDCLLMLDSSWHQIDEFVPVYERVRNTGGAVYTVVYDLLPIQYPEHMVAGGPQWFRGWLERAIEHSDALICISRAVADALSAFIDAQPMSARRRKRIGYWHLGADFTPEDAKAGQTSRVQRAMAERALLIVGSIDPRKNHVLALDAMERLWARGCMVSLCIAGKPGWMVDALMARIATHPELGHRLHYIERPSDAELASCYRAATGLLFPSAGEGFGLPLIEAAHFGTPILASDIPVVHEIAGEHASYFALGSADELAAAIERWLADAAAGRVPRSSDMRYLSWEESAEQLLQVILEHRWYLT